MSIHTRIDTEPKIFRRIKKEVVYEYQEILGGVLGWWRRSHMNRIGTTIELHLRHDLGDFDQVIINGVQVDVPRNVPEE